ncbi:MAG: hypothetical protein ABID64_00195 [Nitrospirota bacterium]
MKKILSLSLIILVLFVSGCLSQSSEDYYIDEGMEEVKIGNPYSSGTGHYAGYEWAKDKEISDPDNCGGNSQSFIEGCRAYTKGY